MDGSIVWKINCATKHGIDTILVRGDSEPTKKQLNKGIKEIINIYPKKIIFNDMLICIKYKN